MTYVDICVDLLSDTTRTLLDDLFIIRWHPIVIDIISIVYDIVSVDVAIDSCPSTNEGVDLCTYVLVGLATGERKGLGGVIVKELGINNRVRVCLFACV